MTLPTPETIIDLSLTTLKGETHQGANDRFPPIPLKNSAVQRYGPVSRVFDGPSETTILQRVPRLSPGYAAIISIRALAGLNLAKPSQVLRGRREEEFVFGAAWAPQPQAPEPKDALEMGKQHLDLFPAATSSLIFRGRSESPGDVAGIFVQITRNLRAAAFGQQRGLRSQTSQSLLLAR